METKMKKIPFDLERAKRGESFRMPNYNYDFFYLSNFGNQFHCKYKDHETGGWQASLFDNTGNWHHLIPDEPKPERWAVVEIMSIHENISAAKESCKALNDYSDKLDDNDTYTVVKLAD